MNHHRKLAAALACALALGLCGGHVLADGTPDSGQAVPTPEIISPEPPPDGTAAEAPAGSADPAAPESPSDGLTTEPDYPVSHSLIVDGTAISPDLKLTDAEGAVSFENLEARLREHNLNILSLDENIESIEAIDLEEMEDGLKMAIRMIKAQQEQLEQLVDGTSAALDGLQAMLDTQNLGLDVSVFQPSLVAYPQATIAALETQIATYQDTLDQLEDGIIESQYIAAQRQMSNAQDQIVMGAQTLYISLLGLEQTTQSLERSLAALDRTLAELEVRYGMGQISALTLAEAKAGRTTLVSSMTTLEMNVTALRRQLEGMLGEELTGTIRLSPLTAVTQAQLDTMDYAEDLEDVLDNSLEVDTAYDAWDTASHEYATKKKNHAADYEIDSARYAERAAELSWKAAKQSVELKFAALYDQVLDQQQVLAAAKTSLAVKQDSYAAAQLKYEQGAISQNKLLEARDALEEAQDAVDTAAIDLFTYFNNYRWAVKSGILN